MTKNILISGGSGFVGGSIIDFIKKDYQCINIGRSRNNLCENIYWDLKENLNCVIDKNIDVVIHSASIVGNSSTLNKSDYIDVNVKSTIELLDFCVKNNVKKFIYISTGGVYGYSEKKLNEKDICNPSDIYSMSKYFSEKICDLYKDKVKVVILRLFFPYGPGQKGRMFNNLIDNIINKKDITLNKNGLPLINPIHIIDVVSIIKKIIETNCFGVFNICGNEFVSIEGLCKKIASYAHVEYPHYLYNDNIVGNMMGSNEKICQLLNYKMKIDLETGIRMYLKLLN